MPDGTKESSTHDGKRLKVGDWSVEAALNELVGNGKTVKLEPKAMAVLCYLAGRPGEVVSRDALLSAVWPGVVVSDDSLTQAVIKLRKALGDTAESPPYIQTIPKGGYRLVAAVTRCETPAPAVAGVAIPPAGQPNRRRAALLGLAGIAAVLLAVVSVWRYKDGMVSEVSPTTAAIDAARAVQPTVSITPLEALGDDRQAALLARGITADLITDLSKVAGVSLVVTAPPAGAETTGATAVRYVVSGSVQRAGERLRLHVRLTDAQTGKQLWSERFDRTVSDLFAMQEELVPKLLQILPAKVSEAELRRIARHHTRNLDAYEYFQRGQAALLVRQQEENEAAREMFRRAIALDASFALAYAALAQTYVADHRNQWTKDRAAALERAFKLALAAHEINSDVRETYWVLALVHLERGQHEQALQYLETAVRLYPSFADAYALMGGINAYLGESTQALRLVHTAMRLNPDAGYLYLLILGRAHFALGDMEQARLNLEHALMRNPVNLEARVYLAASQVVAGNRDAASWEAEEIRSLQPDFSSRAWLATHPLTDLKLRATLAQALGRLGF
jgi:DNA-binding winged helix-turn-helix (wHTH) protein/TolB-like protein/Tfp pilus assembly protein PilF